MQNIYGKVTITKWLPTSGILGSRRFRLFRSVLGAFGWDFVQRMVQAKTRDRAERYWIVIIAISAAKPGSFAIRTHPTTAEQLLLPVGVVIAEEYGA